MIKYFNPNQLLAQWISLAYFFFSVCIYFTLIILIYVFLGFSYLDEEQLLNLTCGTYQLRFSPNYAKEHLKGNCQIQVHEKGASLVRVHLQNQHVSSRIKYDEASVSMVL